jgi:hypothetical protein
MLDPAKIDKLNADINNDLNADAAILTFWFEYAPKHLQLRRDALNNDDLQAQIDRLKAAVGSDLAKQLDPGGQRQEDDLETHRDDVLESWKNAADQQADAEAAYKLRPDDAATLKQRWDKLKDDGWLKDVKSALEKPAA